MTDAWLIEASVGGWPGPAYSIRGHGSCVEYEHIARYDDGIADRVTLDATDEDLAVFWSTVDSLGVWDWSSEYLDPDVLDGTHWSLALHQDGRSVESSGSNAYPERFEELCAALVRLCGGRSFA